MKCTTLFCVAAALVLCVPAFGAEHTVNIDGLSFSPETLTINVGDTVTWINDGGLHNVNADDGSFRSGDPSTDLWQYSVTFHEGGSNPYHCETHLAQGMTGTIIVEGVFGDDLESGTTFAWSDAEPQRPNCTCYFSSDCVTGEFCDYGPGGFATQDICTWRDIKPSGTPGAGCSIPHIGPWGGDICDGLCAPSTAGSTLGHEPPHLVRQGIELWSEAILIPAEAGGGPFDPVLLNDIENLGLEQANAEMNLGRQVSEALILAGGMSFYEYFCHHEQYPGKPNPELFIDLSSDPCRAAAIRLTVDALLADMEQAGSGAAILEGIPGLCDDWTRLFEGRCEGPDPISCVTKRVRDIALFLTTPGGHLVRTLGLQLPF